MPRWRLTGACCSRELPGLTERTRGSHHIFTRAGIEERITLQRDRRNAKVYQVRQVRAIILKHKLGEEH